MNAELLNYIRSLSLKDTKTLSQKALKTTEEVGELAKAILPFDGAHGTNHRFVNKENITEECVDVILCALSIAYSLGSTDSSLERVSGQVFKILNLNIKKILSFLFPLNFMLQLKWKLLTKQ